MVNLSGLSLTETELSLLSKGFKFAPQPPRINRFQLKQEVVAFGRRIRLREFFYDLETTIEEYNPEECRFREKSTWNTPKNRVLALETYLRVVERGLQVG